MMDEEQPEPGTESPHPAFRKRGLRRLTPEDITEIMNEWTRKHPERIKKLMDDPVEPLR